jgi:alpha-L-fucosidase
MIKLLDKNYEMAINLSRRFFLMLTVHLISLCIFSQARPDILFFKDNLQSLSPENIFKTEGYYNWCSSIIGTADGKYHLFYSRWPKKLGFYAWLTHSEIAHAVSKNPAGPWHYIETVLRGRGKGHWDAITAHNPKIKFFDGKYYLYYCSTNMGDRDYTEEELIETAGKGSAHPDWSVLRPNQRTGVAVANSINGPWKRCERPVIEPSGPIATLTVNPAIDRGKDGKYYLIVKGDKPGTRFIRNQAIAVSDSPAGPFIMQPDPVIDYLDTEDMSPWYDKELDYFYGVFHAHTFIGMVSSPDGINWKKATEYVITPKKLKLADGTLLEPDRLERPFIYQETGYPEVLSMAVKKGDDSYIVFVPVKRPVMPLPNKRQLAWQEAELGALFSYDIHVFHGKKYNQKENRINPINDYQIFNPKKLDTDQWIKAIKDAGFTFAILTASHETGFSLYQSDVNPFSMKVLKYKDGNGDIVRDFVNSCIKYGIEPGIYIGIRWNSLLGIHNFKIDGEGEFAENRQKWYNTMVEKMVMEICTRYGEWFEIWFDGGADSPSNGAPDVLPIVQLYQPGCLFYHNLQLAEARWGGSETGTVSYPCWATFPYPSTGTGATGNQEISKNDFQLLKEGDPSGKYWMPAMADAPLRGYNGRHEWFWEPGDDDNIFPLKNLMDIYYKSVGRNSTLIMGLTPDPDGLLPEGDIKRLKEWGDEIYRRLGKPLASISGNGNTLVLDLGAVKKINHVIIMENIINGEKIRKYRIEGQINGKWQILCRGQSVGHKRIEFFDDADCRKIRLIVEESSDNPEIKSLSAFYVE